MSAVYEAAGFSRQAHWKWRAAGEREAQDWAMLLSEVRSLRRSHPMMGGKKLYRILEPESMGRDRFLELLRLEGMLVASRRNPARTTFSVKSSRFPNLMEGLVIDGPDQVWVTDITYFQIGGETFYIVLVMDLYTRRVLGYSVESHMRAQSCLAALEMAFKTRGRASYQWSLIHHSDRGGQYVSGLYIAALERMEIRVSLCLEVYENTHMERLNRTIKSEYLQPYNPRDLADLKRMLPKAVRLYNGQRPHDSLGGLSPIEFEKAIAEIPVQNREKMKVYVGDSTKLRNQMRNQLTIFDK